MEPEAVEIIFRIMLIIVIIIGGFMWAYYKNKRKQQQMEEFLPPPHSYENIGSYLNETTQKHGYCWTGANPLIAYLNTKNYGNGKDDIFIDNFRFVQEAKMFLYSQNHSIDVEKLQKITVRFCPRDFTKTVFALGGMGSGKTEFFFSILNENWGYRHFKRVIIHDPKGDYTEKLYRSDQDYIFNPYDKRGAAWDIWADMHAYPVLIVSFLKNLIESQTQKEDFFSSSAVNVLKEYFMETHFSAKGKSSVEKWRILLDKIDTYRKQSAGKPTEGSIYSTIALAIETLRLLAFIATTNPKKQFSIRYFLSSSGSKLFLLNNPAYSAPLNALFVGFLSVITEALLSQPDTTGNLSLLVLDEFLSLKFNQETKTKVLTQIRSKGGALLLGAQFLPKENKLEQQLLDSSRFALIFFRLSDIETVNHIQEMFGEIEYTHYENSINEGENSNWSIPFSIGGGKNEGMSINTSLQKRKFIKPEMLQSMPQYHHITFIPEDNIIYLGYTPLVQLEKVNRAFVQRDLTLFYQKPFNVVGDLPSQKRNERSETQKPRKVVAKLTKTPQSIVPKTPEENDIQVDSLGNEYSRKKTLAALKGYDRNTRMKMYNELITAKTKQEEEAIILKYGLRRVSLEVFFVSLYANRHKNVSLGTKLSLLQLASVGFVRPIHLLQYRNQ
ncbi:TraG/TraD family protein [Beggiatoa sp. PS]|nr:TraG/TraD family protein [Beggiatoa sp. PS]